jgi:hypothetical protein
MFNRKKYYLEHKERENELSKQYYQENKEKIKEINKQWKRRHQNAWKKIAKRCYSKTIIKNRKIMDDLKLNGCAICGYNKSNRALEFHHINHEDKKFPITLNSIARTDMGLIIVFE